MPKIVHETLFQLRLSTFGIRRKIGARNKYFPAISLRAFRKGDTRKSRGAIFNWALSMEFFNTKRSYSHAFFLKSFFGHNGVIRKTLWMRTTSGSTKSRIFVGRMSKSESVLALTIHRANLEGEGFCFGSLKSNRFKISSQTPFLLPRTTE